MFRSDDFTLILIFFYAACAFGPNISPRADSMSDRFFFISLLAVVSWPHELFSKNWQCLPPIRRNGSNGETGIFCVHRKGKWYGRIDSELVNPLLGRGGLKGEEEGQK